MFSNSWVLIKARKRYNNPYVRYVLFDRDLVSDLSICNNDKFFFAKLGVRISFKVLKKKRKLAVLKKPVSDRHIWLIPTPI